MARPILLAALLVTAVLATGAPGVAAAPCDPDAGPFDPCMSECNPNFQRECDLMNRVGGSVWKCIFGPTCF